MKLIVTENGFYAGETKEYNHEQKELTFEIHYTTDFSEAKVVSNKHLQKVQERLTNLGIKNWVLKPNEEKKFYEIQRADKSWSGRQFEVDGKELRAIYMWPVTANAKNWSQITKAVYKKEEHEELLVQSPLKALEYIFKEKEDAERFLKAAQLDALYKFMYELEA